jgi:hypothetical protein
VQDTHTQTQSVLSRHTLSVLSVQLTRLQGEGVESSCMAPVTCALSRVTHGVTAVLASCLAAGLQMSRSDNHRLSCRTALLYVLLLLAHEPRSSRQTCFAQQPPPALRQLRR